MTEAARRTDEKRPVVAGRLRPDERIERERAFFEMSVDPAIVHDGRSIIMCNTAAAKAFGFDSPDDAIGAPMLKLVHPDSFDGIAECMEALRGGDSTRAERQFRTLDGSREFRADVVSAPIDVDGNRAYHVVLRDISERHEAERALRQSEARLRAILDATPLGMRLYRLEDDDRLVLISANPAADRMFGVPHAPLIGMTIEEAFPGVVNTPMPGIFRRIASEGGFFDTRQFVYADDRVASCFEVHAFQSEPGICAVIFEDVSERIREHEELVQYRTELERIVAERTRDLIKVHEELHAVTAVVSKLVEARDPYTAGHQRRVASLARDIAKRFELDEDAVEDIWVAAKLHDIGKVSIPSDILSKPGQLTPTEYLLVQEHAAVGHEILSSVNLRFPVADLVRQHHERLDGSGYPDARVGEEILFGARILAVADVVEAMSSHRPYRAALGVEVAIDEIVNGAGSRYDQDVVRECVELFAHGYAFDDGSA